MKSIKWQRHRPYVSLWHDRLHKLKLNLYAYDKRGVCQMEKNQIAIHWTSKHCLSSTTNRVQIQLKYDRERCFPTRRNEKNKWIETEKQRECVKANQLGLRAKASKRGRVRRREGVGEHILCADYKVKCRGQIGNSDNTNIYFFMKLSNKIRSKNTKIYIQCSYCWLHLHYR